MNNSKTNLWRIGVTTLGTASFLLLSGCNSLNDNPTDVDKMQEIRKKQDAERSNFKPPMTSPTASTTGK